MNELIEFSLDTENAEKNYYLAKWYETRGHSAAAHTYYLRAAERTEDNLLAYRALIRASFCYKSQGSRDGTEKILLENALTLLPKRPEAYYYLSLIYEKAQQWQNCYIYSSLGLECFNENNELIDIPEFKGKSLLIFQKAVSSWWWGKGNECRSLLNDLYKNYWNTLDEKHKNLVKENCKKVGLKIEPLKVSDCFKLKEYKTDKYELGYLTEVYDKVLFPFENVPVNVLEIGAAYGESIKLWKDYFHSESVIISGDIISYFDNIEGTTQIIGDLYSDELVFNFKDNYFDLIIDDGPHTLESFVKVIKKYYTKLKNEGILIIEDILDKDYLDCLISLAKSIGYESYEVFDLTNKQLTEEAKNRVVSVYNTTYNLKSGLYVLKLSKSKIHSSHNNSIPVLGVPIVNGVHWIKRLIESIDYPVKDLLIINNNGRGEIDDELNDLKYSDNKFIENIAILNLPSNIGVGGAWNLIIKCYLNAPYWIIANNDIAFTPGLLKKMCDESVNTDSGMIHAKKSDWGGGSYDLFLIKDFVVQKCGLFDENLYPAYEEDVDYHIRVINENIKCSFLELNYFHGETQDYSQSGSQTWRINNSLKDKLDKSRIINQTEYLTKKWGDCYHELKTYPKPFNIHNYSSNYTTYDLNFVRKKHLGF